MNEILTALDSLSLELQEAQMWSAQIKLEKIKLLLAQLAITSFAESS